MIAYLVLAAILTDPPMADATAHALEAIIPNHLLSVEYVHHRVLIATEQRLIAPHVYLLHQHLTCMKINA